MKKLWRIDNNMPTELTMNVEPVDAFYPRIVKNDRKLIYVLVSYDETNKDCDPDDKGFLEGVYLTLSGAKERIKQWRENGDWCEFNILVYDMTTGERTDVIYQKRIWSDDGSVAD
jgi:hypothetical protein